MQNRDDGFCAFLEGGETGLEGGDVGYEGAGDAGGVLGGGGGGRGRGLCGVGSACWLRVCV